MDRYTWTTPQYQSELEPAQQRAPAVASKERVAPGDAYADTRYQYEVAVRCYLPGEVRHVANGDNREMNWTCSVA